jgi:hypothetical protein
MVTRGCYKQQISCFESPTTSLENLTAHRIRYKNGILASFRNPSSYPGGHHGGPNSGVVKQRLAGFIHRV